MSNLGLGKLINRGVAPCDLKSRLSLPIPRVHEEVLVPKHEHNVRILIIELLLGSS